MNRGQHIHQQQLRTQNENLKAISPPPVFQNNMEVSLLKLRINELEDTVKKKDEEIIRLFRMLENH